MDTAPAQQRRQPSKRRLTAVGAAAAIVLLVILGVYIASRFTSGLPRPAALTQASQAFTVLYWKDSLPAGLKVHNSDITYTDGILFVSVTAQNNQKIILTQQALPEKFKQSDGLVGADEITGADGPAAISHTGGRTTATMISGDRKTMVIINDTAGVGSTTVMDLMRTLKPYTP